MREAHLPGANQFLLVVALAVLTAVWGLAWPIAITWLRRARRKPARQFRGRADVPDPDRQRRPPATFWIYAGLGLLAIVAALEQAKRPSCDRDRTVANRSISCPRYCAVKSPSCGSRRAAMSFRVA